MTRQVETTTNDVSQFKCFRDVQHRDGSIVRKNAPMKKGIYSLHLLSGLLKASNRRYVEFISTFDDVSSGINNLKKVSETVVTDIVLKVEHFVIAIIPTFSRNRSHLMTNRIKMTTAEIFWGVAILAVLLYSGCK